MLSNDERILEILAKLLLWSVIALIASERSFEIKDSIDFVCISSISFAKPYNFFNSILERFDLINDSDNSTTVSPAI